MTPEGKLRHKLISKFIGAIPIENTAASGTPDIFVPTQLGWRAFELKVIKGNYVYFEKNQIANFSMQLSINLSMQCQSIILIEVGDSYCALSPSFVMNELDLEPYRGKVRADISNLKTGELDYLLSHILDVLII